MSRPTVDQVLMDVARLWARRSTCSRGQTGCVIARDGRVVSSGYNGAPAGMPHCDHSCDCPPRPVEVLAQEHHLPGCRTLKPCTTAVHAEANAVAFAARYGVKTDGTTLYTLFAPCATCAPLLVNAGVVRVVFGERMGPAPASSVGSGLFILEEAGILLDYAVGGVMGAGAT